jgi:hypothetical protein
MIPTVDERKFRFCNDLFTECVFLGYCDDGCDSLCKLNQESTYKEKNKFDPYPKTQPNTPCIFHFTADEMVEYLLSNHE